MGLLKQKYFVKAYEVPKSWRQSNNKRQFIIENPYHWLYTLMAIQIPESISDRVRLKYEGKYTDKMDSVIDSRNYLSFSDIPII